MAVCDPVDRPRAGGSPEAPATSPAASAERALLEYRAIFDSAAVGILYTRNRVFQRCNARGAAILGFTPEELEGLPGRTVYPSDESYDEIGRQAGPLLGAGEAFEADWEWKRKDGRRVWVHIYARAVDPRHTDRGTVWIIEDVTEKRAVEHAHRQTMAELQAILDNSSVAIVLTRDRAITRCNPRFTEMFGWSREEAIGLPGRTIYCTADDYREVGDAAGPLLSKGKPFQRELFVRRKDGKRLWVNLIGYVVDLADPARGTIWLLEDRSAMKQAEEALRRRNVEQLRETQSRLEETRHQLAQSEKLASIGQLAAGVAHEINNPIAFVSSNVNTLGDYVGRLVAMLETHERVLAAADLPPAERAALAAAREEAELGLVLEDIVELLRESEEGLERVRRIVKDLRDFAQGGAGELGPADLNAGFEATLNVVQGAVRHRASFERDLGRLPLVRCRSAQITQVMMNLLVNAAQAIEASGTPGTIRIRTRAEGPWVWLEVEDSGVGMTEEVRQRVFEPFFTTRPVGQGTGLGLSVSYGIVQEHGGRIDVASAPGQGARFRVWLPVAGPFLDPGQAI